MRLAISITLLLLLAPPAYASSTEIINCRYELEDGSKSASVYVEGKFHNDPSLVSISVSAPLATKKDAKLTKTAPGPGRLSFGTTIFCTEGIPSNSFASGHVIFFLGNGRECKMTFRCLQDGKIAPYIVTK